MKFALRTKLFALTTFMVAVIMGTVTYVLTVRQQADRRLNVDAEAKRIANNLATFSPIERQDWDAYQTYITRLMAFNPDIVYIAVYDDRSWLRAWTLSRELVDFGGRAPRDRREERGLVRSLDQGAIAAESQGDLKVQRIIIRGSGDRVLGSVHVGFSLIEINRELRAGVERNALMALGFVALSGLLSFFLSRRLTGPLERLSAAMTAIAGGDLEQRVVPETKDEIGELAQSFNAMVAGLHERRIIDRLGQELGATFRLERLAAVVRERLCGAIGAESAQLFLRQPDEPGAFLEHAGEHAQGPPQRIGLGAAQEAVDYGDGSTVAAAPPAVREPLREAGFDDDDSVLPMRVKGHLTGFLLFRLPSATPEVESKRLRFATTLAAQAALALDNALLYEELREQERLRGEIRVAREVQRRLLPRGAPNVPRYSIDGVCSPASEVGGDYYDFLVLDERRLGIVIADVSGKGASASLYMAELKGMMIPLAALHGSPRRVLSELNRQIYPTLDRHIFISVTYAVLDLEGGHMVFSRAGHTPLLRVSPASCCEALAPSGMAIGLDSGALFDRTLAETTFTLGPGDAAVLFTDGITDAMNGAGESFGTERLLALIGGGGDPQTMRGTVVAAVREFAGDTPQFDDLTMVAVRYDGATVPAEARARGGAAGSERPAVEMRPGMAEPSARTGRRKDR